MGERLNEIETSESESKFQDMLAIISTSSLRESKDYLTSVNDNSKNSPTRLNNKVHEAYQSYHHSRGGGNPATRTMSNSSGGKPYKVKSMISYSEEEERKNEKKLNDKRLKKSISQTSSGSSNGDKKVKKKKSFLQKIGFKKS
ncbi:uncharacterized protein CXQ87_001420 [Candidozyma duobushaemuli]|uniref:Uncharacterized protein n=1 Tax=Candidozyma duobushaemuli TaxID=1231522 RepID=A0A2V1AKA4_9ASCO|nr:uncharacterized protein CXQ87_001420 [[Candida] duobushaemulonis]PVH18490.1 hypothetical protein CXQ87_001420 [[Candida] duobushaemulonis]